MRQFSLFICLSITVFLVGGCAATSPATEANLGNDQALINLVMSSQVSANTVLPFYETTKTAFCALLPSKSAVGAAAIDKLLQQGADVNKKCQSDVTPDLPLDVVIHFIGYANEPGPAQSPQDSALFQARAEKLLALGAKSARGSTQIYQVLEEAAGYTDALLGQIVLSEEMQRQAKKDSILNLNNLTVLSQIVGGVANNYAAAKGTPTSSLNLLAQLPATSSQEKQKSETFSRTRTESVEIIKRGISDTTEVASDTAQRTPKKSNDGAVKGSQAAIPNLIVDRDIQEPKPDFGGLIWMYGGGERTRKPLATRAEACQHALRDMDETIALDAKLRSFSGIERRTDCICSYFAHYKNWSCRSYYLTRVNSAQGSSR